jgi:hypothetical protein
MSTRGGGAAESMRKFDAFQLSQLGALGPHELVARSAGLLVELGIAASPHRLALV